MRLDNRGEYHGHEYTDLNVYFTAENLWDETPILTPQDIKDRISPENCLREWNDEIVIKGTGRPSECYKLQDTSTW